MYKLQHITYKLNISPSGFSQFVSDCQSLHIDKIHKNKINSYNDIVKWIICYFFSAKLLGDTCKHVVLIG